MLHASLLWLRYDLLKIAMLAIGSLAVEDSLPQCGSTFFVCRSILSPTDRTGASRAAASCHTGSEQRACLSGQQEKLAGGHGSTS